MMRNIDEIKRLKKELGRYQKKVADQAKEIAGMKGNLQSVYIGEREIQRGVDAILAQTAITYGKEVTDEESGEKLGYSLSLPMFQVGDILSRYEVHARRDKEKDLYVVGVVPREGGDG